ncbi:MAG: hypothetical protein MPF33_01165 [Candidatus Aramenus sp.]|jgi:hypothetical protein|nr:hypothetical protein [Candidatus Aramenus sp.]
MDYVNLLKSQNPYDRLDAWFKAEWLLNNGMATREELGRLKDYFLELLSHPDETVRLHAWQQSLKLLPLGVINLEDLKVRKGYFLDALNDAEGWLLALDLLRGRVVTKEELKEKVPQFLSLLKGNELNKVASWSLVPQMISEGVVVRGEAEALKRYLFDLLDSPAYDVQFNVLFLIAELYERGFLKEEDAKNVREKL